VSGGGGERTAADRGVEVEVGGSGLILLGLLVLALCAGSFWLGRWSARAAGPPASPPAAPIEDGGDAADDLTFFDRLERAPELSAQGDERTVAPPAPAAPAPAAAGGTFEVQVLASADRAAAEAVVARLQRRDYPARLVVGDRDGRAIYRVRVGGYADEAAARRAALAIEREEGLRTWVVR
jgi:cell division protein FtsN